MTTAIVVSAPTDGGARPIEPGTPCMLSRCAQALAHVSALFVVVMFVLLPSMRSSNRDRYGRYDNRYDYYGERRYRQRSRTPSPCRRHGREDAYKRKVANNASVPGCASIQGYTHRSVNVFAYRVHRPPPRGEACLPRQLRDPARRQRKSLLSAQRFSFVGSLLSQCSLQALQLFGRSGRTHQDRPWPDHHPQMYIFVHYSPILCGI